MTPDTETTGEAEPIKFVSANPPSGSTLRSEATLSVLFDGIPKNLTVSPGVAMVSGQTATISGPFPLGELRLSLTWADGTHTLLYTVEPQPVPEYMVLIPAGEFEIRQYGNRISGVFGIHLAVGKELESELLRSQCKSQLLEID